MAGYTRNDVSNNIAIDNLIRAADLDGEFDAIEAAFNVTTGHTHDGTAAEGGAITVIGPNQDIIASGTAIRPKIDNVYDLGTATYEWKDLYVDGTAYIDTLETDNLNVNGGGINGVAIGGTTPAAGTFTTMTATTVDINGGTIDGTTIGASVVADAAFNNAWVDGNLIVSGLTDITPGTHLVPSTSSVYDLGSSLYTWRNLYVDGISYLDSINALYVEIGGGVIDNVVIGGTSTYTGDLLGASITSLSAPLSILYGGTSASDPAGARSNLGLGSMSTQNSDAVTITGGSISNITPLAVADGGTGATTATNAKNNLGIGTLADQDNWAVDITGGSIVGITDLAIADGGTGASTAANARSNLGLGSIATQDSTNVSISGGSISGTIFPSNVIGLSNGGTGANTALAARSNLGLGTMATQNSNAVSISGGTINGVAVGNYATQSWVTGQNFAYEWYVNNSISSTESWVSSNFIPTSDYSDFVNVNGDTMSGSLTINNALVANTLQAVNSEIRFGNWNSTTNNDSLRHVTGTGWYFIENNVPRVRLSISGEQMSILATGSSYIRWKDDDTTNALDYRSYIGHGSSTYPNWIYWVNYRDRIRIQPGDPTATTTNATTIAIEAHYDGLGLNGYYDAAYDANVTGDLLVSSEVVVGTRASGTTNGITLDADGSAYFSKAGPYIMTINNRGTDGSLIGFQNSGAYAGRIYNSGNAIGIDYSSDYRIKDNISPIVDGIERVKKTNPCHFNFIDRPDIPQEGFIAHELQEAVPLAVDGEKDAVYENGKIKVQTYRPLNMIPTLTAALKEAIAKIEQLEERVKELENAYN